MFPLKAVRRLLLLCLLTAIPAFGQFNPPYVYSAVSTADYAGTIAQGSMFIVFGANIGPAQLVQAASYPLMNQLAGTSITVMSGTAILACPMVYTAGGVAAAILPSNTPGRYGCADADLQRTTHAVPGDGECCAVGGGNLHVH